MTFSSFYDEFPDLIKTEIKWVEILDKPDDFESFIPAGHYKFSEFFCIDVNCDCKIAVIHVVSYDPDKSWATIIYDWRREEHMYRFQMDPQSKNDQLKNEFLGIFKRIIHNDKRYAARIERHYLQFKERMQQQNLDGEQN